MRDDRGVSTAFNYVLILFVVTMLTSGLVAGLGGIAENQQQQAIRMGLETTGQRLATDIATADRLVRLAGGNGTVRVVSDRRRLIAGSRYRVTISAAAGDEYELRLHTREPNVTVFVSVRTRTPLATEMVRSGRMAITYNESANVLEVTRND